MSSHDADLHDRGLAFDLSTLLDRRRALKLIAGLGLVAFGACAADDDTASPSGSTTGSTGSSTTSTTSSPSSTAGSDEAIPQETGGPYPGDGSNGPNVLDDAGIVRRDIRSSFGSSSGTAAGIPLAIELTLLDSSTGKPLEGAALYLWHCDREGRYSLYSNGVTDQNYLRGVQVAGAEGKLSFQSIFPAAYSGRWPHIHFEVYETVAKATSSGSKLATSQLALPEDVCRTVYATSGYEASVRNLSATSLSTDMVFRDDKAVHQLATVTGSTSAGYTAALTVNV